MFFDPQPQLTLKDVKSIDNEMTTNFFDTTKDAGDYGAINLKTQIISTSLLTNPYYVVFRLPAFLVP